MVMPRLSQRRAPLMRGAIASVPGRITSRRRKSTVPSSGQAIASSFR
jgi:hypothetical protein